MANFKYHSQKHTYKLISKKVLDQFPTIPYNVAHAAR
jgi:hypothetical protein